MLTYFFSSLILGPGMDQFIHSLIHSFSGCVNRFWFFLFHTFISPVLHQTCLPVRVQHSSKNYISLPFFPVTTFCTKSVYFLLIWNLFISSFTHIHFMTVLGILDEVRETYVHSSSNSNQSPYHQNIDNCFHICVQTVPILQFIHLQSWAT